MICETPMRCEKHAKRNMCERVISYFYAASRDRFLVSHVSNHLTVEAVIIHEIKGFSRAIRDKIIVQENNRIAKHV